MDKKKLLLAGAAILILIVGMMIHSTSKENKYKKFVAQQTQEEAVRVAEEIEAQGAKRWVEIEKDDEGYRIRAERGTAIEIPETQYLVRETLKNGDTETISYMDGEGSVAERVEISYYDAPKLAILIDDVGMSMGAAGYFGEIDEALTFATIPFLPKSREATAKLQEDGFEVILHMPMAGSSDSLNSRTEGILLPTMSKDKIYDAFDRALEDVGRVDGFNNHMGSRLTANEKKMRELLGYAKRKELYFIDSNTAVNNLGYPISKELGLPTYYASHFLDNSRDMEDMKREIRRSVGLAKHKGQVLVIGHYHKGMAIAIKEMLPYIEEQGVKLVFARELLETN